MKFLFDLVLYDDQQNFLESTPIPLNKPNNLLGKG